MKNKDISNAVAELAKKSCLKSILEANKASYKAKSSSLVLEFENEDVLCGTDIKFDLFLCKIFPGKHNILGTYADNRNILTMRDEDGFLALTVEKNENNIKIIGRMEKLYGIPMPRILKAFGMVVDPKYKKLLVK